MGKGHIGKRDHGQWVGDMGKGDLNQVVNESATIVR